MEQAIYHFQISGEPIEAKPFGHGHINYTFHVRTTNGSEYILQRINKHVFKNPEQLMENVIAVTEHIRSKTQDPFGYLNFVLSDAGKYYYVDNRMRYWRCYRYIRGLSQELPQSDDDFYQSGVAFGRFQEQLSDFDANRLHETIPNFHNTYLRLQSLKKAVDEDACNRVDAVHDVIDTILGYEREAQIIPDYLAQETIPIRVTHNDTKLNNVLLDEQTHRPICVLDLDTVMPGSSLFDFGDSIRFGAATSVEDETDLSKMGLNLALFDCYSRGYLSQYQSLNDLEMDLLPFSAKIITIELASRFLTDYLEGDHYFKIDYPEHNLVRARAQLKLALDMEKKMDEMHIIINRIKEKG